MQGHIYTDQIFKSANVWLYGKKKEKRLRGRLLILIWCHAHVTLTFIWNEHFLFNLNYTKMFFTPHRHCKVRVGVTGKSASRGFSNENQMGILRWYTNTRSSQYFRSLIMLLSYKECKKTTKQELEIFLLFYFINNNYWKQYSIQSAHWSSSFTLRFCWILANYILYGWTLY